MDVLQRLIFVKTMKVLCVIWSVIWIPFILWIGYYGYEKQAYIGYIGYVNFWIGLTFFILIYIIGLAFYLYMLRLVKEGITDKKGADNE